MEKCGLNALSYRESEKKAHPWVIYRGEKKGLQMLLSYSQAGPGRKAKQGQEEISRNHVPTFFLGSVQGSAKRSADFAKLQPGRARRNS